MNAAEIARLNTVIAKLTYMTHGHVGVDWRSGSRFVTFDKGNEFAALCSANETLRYARTALEQSQAALATTQLKMVDDREDYQKLTAEAQREASALRARLEAAKKMLSECAERLDTHDHPRLARRARAAIAEMENGV